MAEFELLLIRHGDAENSAPGGDSERALTAGGRESMRRAALALGRLGLDWQHARTSPYTRARQTEEAVREVLKRQDTTGMMPVAEAWDLLIPAAHPQDTVEAIMELREEVADGDRVALFGHNPNMTTLASLLIAGHPSAYVNVGRGDVVHLLVPENMPFQKPSEDGPVAILLGFYPRKSLEKLVG